MSSRGAFGAPTQKHKSQNVNSVYSGKNTAASKASGPSKHGGLQALGRTSTIVRRMPKPATLPSLKAEHGQDPQVCLVPQGGQGWSKSSTEQPNADSKTLDANSLSAVNNGPDLRPNWAKPVIPAGTPPAGAIVSGSGAPTPATGISDGSQPQPSTGATQGSEYPTLAAAMKLGSDASQKKELAEEPIPLPKVLTPQPAGYIGASGPRVSDRKLPARYYGGPDSAQRPTSQKYDFMQKMAKLSLDKESQQQHSQSPEEPDHSQKSQQTKDSLSSTTKSSQKQQDGRRGQQQHATAMSGEYCGDRQRLSSESTTDSTLQKRSFEQSQQTHESFGTTPDDVSAAAGYALQRSAHQHQPPSTQKHGDGSLPGRQASGRGDTGFTSQCSDIQQHQNPPSGRHCGSGYADRSSAGRDGYDGGSVGDSSTGMTGGAQSGYHYVTPPPSVHHSYHHSQHANKRYDDVNACDDATAGEQHLYRAGVSPQQQQQQPGYGQMMSHGGVANWSDDMSSKPMPQRSTRQPLLSSQPPQQQQPMHYRNSDSESSGWNASIGNFHVTSNNRRGTASGAYTHQAAGWYGSNHNSNNNGSYPPSLMSLETSMMAVYENAVGGAGMSRYNRQQQHYGAASVPRNGPVTGGYPPASASVDEQFSRSEVTDNAQAKLKSGGRRALSTELSSGGENDAHGYLADDFFNNEPGDFDNEKGLWDRSVGYGSVSLQQQLPTDRAGAEAPAYKKSSEQPPIRMLKRNDEKSAEYFAYYSTSSVLAGAEANSTPSEPSSLTDAGNNNDGLGSYQPQNTKKSLLPHKSKVSEETKLSGLDSSPASGNSYREFHRRDRQSSLYKKNGNESSQNFGSATTINPNQSITQQQTGTQQQKFNRAPGGEKSLHVQQQQRNANNKQNESATAAPTKPTGDQVNNSTPSPPENVWEKRKEERLLAEKKGLTAKQRRQLDQHFPLMSEAAKIETSANELPNTNFIREAPRNQDVRMEQKNFGNLGGRGYPQWNPPTMGGESHWDELAASSPNNRSSANGERRGNRRNNSSNETRQRGAVDGSEFAPASHSSASYGGRREFVNSKNRTGGGSNAVNGTTTTRGTRGAKLRNNTLQSSTTGRSGGERFSKQSKPADVSAGGDQLLKVPNDVEQDNFSNMGEFHAEDYKIDTADKSKSRSKGSAKSKAEKDGRIRRSTISGKRGTGDQQVRRRSRQEHAKGIDNEAAVGLLNGNSAVPDANAVDADQAVINGGQQSRQGQQRSQRAPNVRRVGGRSATSTQARSSAVGGARGNQRQATRSGAGVLSRGKERQADVDPTEVIFDQPSVKTHNLADRSTQLKSPVISDGGQEEWETASESSDFGRTDDGGQPKGSRNSADRENTRKTNGALTNGGAHRRANNNGDFFDDSGQEPQSHSQPPKNAGQKNAKPASHTFQSHAESANNNKSNKNSNNNINKNNKRYADSNALNSQEKTARDGRKGISSFPVRDGLAGVDINDASVVVIDNYPDLYSGAVSSESVAGDFEEVLSKKAKRQRLQQMEEERRRQEREKERQEKILAKRTKQQQRRAEKLAAKKANETKKDERSTMFTNPNHMSIGVEVFDQSKDSTEKNDKINGEGNKTNDSTFMPQVVQQKSPAGNLGNIATGFDELAMTTVWNSALSAVSSVAPSSTPSSNVVTSGLESSGVYTALTSTTVIPSPIARPVPKNSRPPTSTTTSTWSTDSITALNDESKEKFDFTFDPSIKGSLKGSSVDGLDSTDQPLQMKSRYDNLRRSCSPGRGISAMPAGSAGSPVNGISVLGDLKSKSMAVENSDHAQLQKKLDRVKDFWPGSSVVQSSHISSSGLSGDHTVADSTVQRLNVAKVKPQPHHADDRLSSSGNSSRTDALVSSNSYSAVPCGGNMEGQNSHNHSMSNKAVGTKDYNTSNRASNILFTEFSSCGGFIPMSSTAPQSPSATFGLSANGGVQNASHLGALPSYQIMLRNGDFLTQTMISAQSANSPPTQHIIAQPSNGIIGAQRSSRPNSLKEHTLIMAQQPNGVSSTTPWSTAGGFEFLNGINPTPPPPISAPTPGSGVGRSSIPPAAVNSAIGQHYPPQLAMIAPQSKMPVTRMGSMNYGGYGGCDSAGASIAMNAGAMMNFQNHGVPPSHQMPSQHPTSVPPPSNMFGAPPLPPHNGKIVGAVPSMSVPPPPLASTHMPPLPPHHFPPSLSMAHGMAPFIPPQHSQTMDWTKQHALGSAAAAISHKQFPPPFLTTKDGRTEQYIDHYRSVNTFGACVPLDFSAPPPPLNGAQFPHGGGYRGTSTVSDIMMHNSGDKAGKAETKYSHSSKNNSVTESKSSTAVASKAELDSKRQDAGHCVIGGQKTAACAQN